MASGRVRFTCKGPIFALPDPSSLHNKKCENLRPNLILSIPQFPPTYSLPQVLPHPLPSPLSENPKKPFPRIRTSIPLCSISLSIRLSSLVFGIGFAFIGWSLIGTRVKPSSVTIFPMLRHHLVPPRPLPPPPPPLSPWPSSSYITWYPYPFPFSFLLILLSGESMGFFVRIDWGFNSYRT